MRKCAKTFAVLYQKTLHRIGAPILDLLTFLLLQNIKNTEGALRKHSKLFKKPHNAKKLKGGTL